MTEENNFVQPVHICLTPESLGGTFPFRFGLPTDDDDGPSPGGYFVAVFTPTKERKVPARGVSYKPLNFCPICGEFIGLLEAINEPLPDKPD